MSDDFEVVPVGTKQRLEELERYAIDASEALGKLAAGGRYPVPTVSIARLELAEPLFCEARVETRIRNAGRRYSPTGRRS